MDADDPVQAQPDETQGAELLEMEYCCFEVDMAQEAKGEELLTHFKSSQSCLALALQVVRYLFQLLGLP